MSRCQKLDDLYIQSEHFDMAKPDEVRKFLKEGIKTDKKALAMLKKLQKRAFETITRDQKFFIMDDHFLVSYININGLRAHYKYLLQDFNIMESSIIGIGETGLQSNTSTSEYALFPPHEGRFF